MANTKISALTSATTPVAGTETLPVVQGGATKQVSIANLTAGRAVSAASLALTGSPLPVSSGGTNATSAGITAFNNITGYSATGASGVTSSKLVFNDTAVFSGVTYMGSATGQNGVFNAVVGNGGANSGLVIVPSSTGKGWLGFNNGNTASIPGQFTYDFSAGVMNLFSSGDITFNTNASGTVMTKLFASGGVSIGNTTDPGASNLSVSGAVSTAGGTNSFTANSTTRFLSDFTNTSRNIGDEYAIRTFLGSNASTSGYHLYSQTGGVLKAFIDGDGTFGSATSTYGGTSDLKLKQDIVDAGSQWNDVKSFKFKKYRFKSDPNGQLQLGVVAQDLEQTSPGLVYETDDLDASGNNLGTVTKNVKYSIMYMKAVIALQEAMEKIEKLEADVAALKG